MILDTPVPTTPSPVSTPQVLDRPDPFRHESQVRSYARSFPTTFLSASGATMVDETGRRYIDFLSGCSALNYGHNDPDMAAALVDYITSQGVTHGLDMQTGAKAEFLRTFDELILRPRSLDYRLQFPGPTGTNAVEAAMKLARKVTGRSEIISFTNGFHGVTAGALAATGYRQPATGNRQPATGNRTHRMAPHVPLGGVSRALFDGYLGDDVSTTDLLDRLLSDPSSGYGLPAAFIVETVQGEGGINAASTSWMRDLARVAHRHGALLIVDDIQAGCGRTGSFFSFDGMGLQPDIVILSKSLSGFGLPMSLVLIHPDHDQWLPAEHNGTFRGNNHAFVTATVALRKFWSTTRLTDEIQRRSETARIALAEIQRMIPGSRIKGRGFMLGIDVGSGQLAGAICRDCFDHGLIIETSGAHDEVVKLLAPLTIDEATLNAGLRTLIAAARRQTLGHSLDR